MAQKPHGEAFLFLFPTALMPHFSLTHKPYYNHNE